MLSLKNIDHRVSEFIIKTNNFCLDEFKKEWFIVILYGSYAKQIAHTRSDLDLMIVTDNVYSKRVNRIIEFIHQLHDEYEMELDFEIPYENKVCISRSYLEQSCSGEPIFKKNQWTLNKIATSQPIIVTDDLMKRFIIGMMTNQHIFAGGDYSSYCNYKNLAIINIIQAIFNISNKSIINLQDIINYMYSLNNVNDRDLIGFRSGDPSNAYIVETLIKTIYEHPYLFKLINNNLDVRYLGNNLPIEINELINNKLNKYKRSTVHA